VVLTSLLYWRDRDATPRLLSTLIFGVSMIVLYATSAIFHLGAWRAPRYRLLRALDHANIFVAIAGTYTPLCISILDGWLRALMLCLIWLLAAIGIGLKLAKPRMSRGLSNSLYIGMGWVAALPLQAFWARLPLQAMQLLVLGGTLYTVGAVVYGWRWPDPWPRVFGFHEVFHLFVIGGSVATALVIWGWM
jgi:hemolysin III